MHRTHRIVGDTRADGMADRSYSAPSCLRRMGSLDATNLRLLAELADRRARSARRSSAAASACRRPPSPSASRRLERDGVIIGYRADVAPAALGYTLAAVLRMRPRRARSRRSPTSRARRAGVGWLRIAAAAVIFALAPARGVLRNPDVIAWGVVLALMNCCFYAAIDRLHLATVAAIEFLPVIVLAALGARTCATWPRSRSPSRASTCSPACSSRASRSASRSRFANAGAVRGLHRPRPPGGQRPADQGIDGLAGAMLIALVAVTPMAGWAAVPAFADPVALLAGIGVGVSISVIPYVADQVAMARLTPRRLRADGLAAARDGDRRRPGRAHPGAVGHRRAGDRARHRGRGAPSRAQAAASRTTVAAAALISCSDAHSRGEWYSWPPVNRFGVGRPIALRREPSVPPRIGVGPARCPRRAAPPRPSPSPAGSAR